MSFNITLYTSQDKMVYLAERERPRHDIIAEGEVMTVVHQQKPSTPEFQNNSDIQNPGR
jgi:hypothetical protein